MPYNEDGETWDLAYNKFTEGMAENKPGHKSFNQYKLPKWVKHPMSHPFSGLFIDCPSYAYACLNGAQDGLTNYLNLGPGHVAGIFGDMEMLAACSTAELNARTLNGETPAHFAISYGHPWILQGLVERGADTTSPASNGVTPEQLIYSSNRNHTIEREYLEAALKGELTEKKNVQAQEYKLKKWRAEGLDTLAEEFLDGQKQKQRLHMFKMGDFQMPYEIPSAQDAKAKNDVPSSAVAWPPAKKKKALPVALLFPGQGSQYVGMLKDCINLPSVQAMLTTAQQVLGWDVQELMLQGPEEKLSETKHCQPAMFIAGMAAVEVMKQTKRELVDRCQAVAGLSLGEYTAICAAGVLSFEDCLGLVKVRAEAMQLATELVPQSMCSVAGKDRITLEKLCADARAADTKDGVEPICQIANVLFPAGFTCAGNKSTVDKLCVLAMEAKALQARVIKAGGAFHTPLMQPAQEQLSKALSEVLPKMKPPRCAIYFNLTGKRVQAGTPPSEFIDLMKKQLTGEVLWEQTVRQMIMDQVKDFYEVGPLKQIKSMIKRIDQDAFKRTENISV